MIRAMKKAALSNCVGTCQLCGKPIVGENGYTEYFEYVPEPKFKYHVECMHKSVRSIGSDDDELKAG